MPAACVTESSRTTPASLRELALTDQEGERLDASSLGGHVLLLNFMFTRCPGPCPRLTRLLADARKLLPDDVRESVRLLSLSVDPEHDDAASLAAFARSHSVDFPEWHFARLSTEDLDVLSERLTVFDPGAAAKPSAHSMRIYLFDRKGRPLQRYDGNLIDSQHLAREVAAADTVSRDAD